MILVRQFLIVHLDAQYASDTEIIENLTPRDVECQNIDRFHINGAIRFVFLCLKNIGPELEADMSFQ